MNQHRQPAMFSPQNLSRLTATTNDSTSFGFQPQQTHLSEPSFSPNHLTSNKTTIGEQQGDTDKLDHIEGQWISSEPVKKREVYRFQADWLVSTVAWSNDFGDEFNLAISSYIEDYNNYVKIVRLAKDAFEQELEDVTTFAHPYPATKILWIPRQSNYVNPLPQLIATTADYLRLWRVQEPSNQKSFGTFQAQKEVYLECLLNNDKGKKHCDPLTSFDWNDIDPSIIITASVDTTVAIWDIEVGKQVDSLMTSPEKSASQISENAVTNCNLKTKLYLHEQEVYDVSFSRSGSGKDVFASAGADGCVRLFDLRGLRSSSTVLFETDPTKLNNGDEKALVRVGCNKRDSNLIGTFAINSNEILILDVRYPGRTPLASLSNHTGNLNSISWAPHSAHHICSASDDQQALIWELSKLPNPIEEPLLAYRANGKINTISWSASQSDWIAIGYENYLELLRV